MLNLSSQSASEAEPKRHRAAKILAGIAGGLVLLVLLILSGAAILLHSARFHGWLLEFAQKKATQSLGAPVTIQNYAAHPSSLSVDIYGVTIHGAAPYEDPPLLEAAHIAAGVRVVSLWHRKWYFDNLAIDHPVARVFVDAHGLSNLPKPKTSSSGSSTNLFDLGIRHAQLTGGEVYFNDKKSTLAADLHDVDFNASYNPLGQMYSGSLRYSNGHLESGNYRPIPHALDAQFTATPTTFTLQNAKLTSGASQLVLNATAQDYSSSPQVKGNYTAVLNGGEIGGILRNPSIPSGLINASGTLAYNSAPDTPLLDAAQVNGTLSSTQLNIKTATASTTLRGLIAQYALANGNLQVSNLRARLLGGELAANLSMRNLAGASQSKLNASVRNISLADLKQLAPRSATTRNLRVSGALNATADATWGPSFTQLVARTDATLRGRLASAAQPTPIPVNGIVHGTYTAAGQQITLTRSSLSTPDTTLTLNGTVGTRAGLAVRLESSNLAELESLADLVRTPAPGAPAPAPLGLSGTGAYIGTVHGPLAAPQLTGQLTAQNLAVKGTEWRTLSAAIDAGPTMLRVQHADLEPAGQGSIRFDLSAQLRHWSFTQTSPIEVDVQATQLDVANLEKLSGSTIPATGTLAVNLRAHGTLLDPIGQGTISLAQASVDQQPIPSANIRFTAANHQVHTNLVLHTAGGALTGTATVEPEQKTYSAQLDATGIHLAQIHALTGRDVDPKAVIALAGHGQGSFSNPEFQATLHTPQFSIDQQTIENITLALAVQNHIATAHLQSQAIGTSLAGNATVQLTADYPAQATLDTQAIPLAPLLALYAPQAAGVTGSTELHATLRGPLKNKQLMEVHVTVPMLRLAYGANVQLAAASPIHIDYKNGVLDLERVALHGTDTSLELQGTLPVASHAPMSVLLLGTVDLKLAQLFSPDLRSGGQLRFNINSYGARTDPNVEGQVQIVEGSFANGNLPLGVQHANGVLVLTRDRLNVQSFQATVGGGKVTAQGGVAYRPSLQFDLGVSAAGVRMLYPQGMREQLDADLRLAGTSDNALLGGQVRLDNLSFTPDFDLMNFVSQLSGGVAAPPAQGFTQNLQLALSVNSSSDMNLVSRTLSIDGTANLQVRGTAAQPVILGRINLNDGDLIFNGNRFTLAGGTVEFVNPAQTEPVVNLALNTTIQQYNIMLRFNGPVDQLRTNYASDPSLPSADIINLLAFGSTTEASAANPTPGNQAAMSAVAGQVSSQITSRVAKVAGISQLSINPVLAGGSTQGPAGAVVTVQQRVTGNLFVTFSTNVATTQNQVIMGQYKVSPRVSVSATRDQNGGFGFDTTFRKSW